MTHTTARTAGRRRCCSASMTSTGSSDGFDGGGPSGKLTSGHASKRLCDDLPRVLRQQYRSSTKTRLGEASSRSERTGYQSPGAAYTATALSKIVPHISDTVPEPGRIDPTIRQSLGRVRPRTRPQTVQSPHDMRGN